MKTHFLELIFLLKGLLLILFLSISVMGKTKDTISDSTNISDKKVFTQAINFCPVALAIGLYSMNYEKLLTDHHGILLRADYESIPDYYFDAGYNINGKAAILNYRYHIEGGLESCFIGAFLRYRMYNGSGKLDESSFDFELSEVTIGANVGKRWILQNGFNFTIALGYGVFMDKQSSNNSDNGVMELIHKFQNEYDLYNGFFGELSVGYAF